MNYRVVSFYLSLMIFILCGFISIPLGIGYLDKNPKSVEAYGITLLLMIVVGACLFFVGRGRKQTVFRRDAFGIVAFIWVVLGFFGALPLWLEGAISSPVSALFEAVSGFTTTGATVLSDVDGQSRATNMWRCLSHWIGGMGIVVLFVAIFPQLGVGAKHMFKAEAAGPISEGLKPRIKQTALRLWWIYSSLTALCALILIGLGMPIFDSICHAFSTLSTGGFSTKGASIGAYSNASIEWVTACFMFIGGLNFGLYYAALHGQVLGIFKNFEFKIFLTLNLFVAAVITYFIYGRYGGDVVEAFRYGLFQTLAVTTTTGLMTDDFDKYPDFARFLLFSCMFIGGCAGSTAGGIKVSRIHIAVKAALQELKHVVHPNTVTSLKIDGRVISQSIVLEVLVFIGAYFMIFFLASIILTALGLDVVTAMSAVVASLSSIGPGLAGVGPIQNYEFVPGLGKLVLCFCMIAGRLEIFALLALFTKDVWRK